MSVVAEPPVNTTPWLRLAWRQFRLERKLFWRNPGSAFFNFALPLIILALFGAVFSGDEDSLRILIPGIAGMSIMSTTFQAFAHNVSTLRENGILKRMRGTPLPSSAYLAGLAGNAIANTALQVAIVVLAGRLVFGIGWPQDLLSTIVFVVLGGLCFSALGVALAHAIPNPESAPTYVNAIFLPVVMVSGVFYDAADAPDVLRDIAQALPLKHLIDGLSGAMIHGEGVGDHLVAVTFLLIWGGLGALLAVRGFSWDRHRG